MRVAVFGAGSIGSFFAKHLVTSNLSEASELFLVVKSFESARKLKFEFPRATVVNGIDPEFIPDLLILATKPQDFNLLRNNVFNGWKDYNPLVISMITGVPVLKLNEKLSGYQRVIRCMPNFGFVFHEGVNGIFCPDNISNDDHDLVDKIFENTGVTLKVKNESELDIFAAVSASGIGYLAMLYDKILNSVSKMGLEKPDADLILRQTLNGFLVLLNSGLAPLEIEKLVTSKGGTTAAGNSVLTSRKVPKAIDEALNAALARAKELSIG
jgi:pyrroline-5-carboxylate reductase